MLVTDLAELLHAIHSGTENKSTIAQVLPYPAWNISAETLWKLALSQHSRSPNWLEMMVVHSDAKVSKMAIGYSSLLKLLRHYRCK